MPDEVPVGDTSVVCFKYTLEDTLCEVPSCPCQAQRSHFPKRGRHVPHSMRGEGGDMDLNSTHRFSVALSPHRQQHPATPVGAAVLHRL